MAATGMIGSLIAPWIKNNEIFDATSIRNRDNTFGPYLALKNAFEKKGITLNTSDLNLFLNPQFELHQDVQKLGNANFSYLLMFETPMIKAENASRKFLAPYRRVFTWDDGLVDGDRYIKINFPNVLTIPSVDGFKDRDRFCCLIAGNKSIKRSDPRNLYPERISAIRWFELNAKGDFDLYGPGWKLPAKRNGFVGRLINLNARYIYPHLKLTAFPSYRGMLENKSDALLRTRFAICYENFRDLPGYITEKIFDCFMSGCVPVYWGASNIERYIPSGCFIDRRRFLNIEEVYQYLKNINEDEFRAYQKNIASFVGGEAAIQFGADYFAETIVNAVVEDLAS